MSVGVIGAGNWGKNHVRTFKSLNSLAGVADVNSDVRQSLAKQYPGVPLYSDYKELLQSPVQAIVIATPACTHFKIAKEALNLGKDVFVEKPMTTSRNEAESLVDIAQKNNRILMVGHLLLYQPAITWIRKFIDSGAMGSIAFISQERLKLKSMKPIESVLWELGTHDVSVLLYLLGEKPLLMYTSGQDVLQKGIEDNVHLHFKFPRGTKSHVHVSSLWPEKRRRLTIAGEKSILTYDEFHQKVLLDNKVVFEGNEEPLLLECRHFLECILHRKKPLTDGRCSLDVIEILENAEKIVKGERL